MVKVSLSLIIRKRIWYKRVFVSRCTHTNCWVFDIVVSLPKEGEEESGDITSYPTLKWRLIR